MWSIYLIFGLTGIITGNNEILTSSSIYSLQQMIITETGNVAIHEHLGSSIKRSRCVLKLDKNDIDKFRRLVFYHESELVYLKLVPREGVSIKDDPSTVGANIWTWTYYGKHGGIKFLRWPIEFGIWSTGLLNNYVFSKPMEMNLKWDSGNCSNLHVGNNEDDTIISAALLSLSVAMNNVEPDKYNATFFCYKRRNFIEGDFLYNLCKNIMCPIQALKYHCCNTYYNVTYGKRLLTCSRTTFVYDTISWILPALGSVILIVVSPLFFLKAVHKFSRYGNSEFDCQMEGLNRHMTLVNDNNQSVVSEFVFHDGGHHVTLFRTLLRPFCLCFRYVISSSHPYMFSVWKRFIRFSIPFLSLVFIAVQVCFDCMYLYEFVLSSIRKGVPLGFRSMVSGFEESKKNFLPWLGGPFVAVGVYLFITMVLLGVPSSVSELLCLGLPSSSCHESNFPICVKDTTIERLGSVSLRRRKGFNKIQKVLEGQFYMLLNVQHWKRIVIVQRDRWNVYFYFTCLKVFFPFYFIYCVIEIIGSSVYFGCPIISFGFIIIRAYCRQLWSQKKGNSCSLSVLFGILTLIFVMSVVYFLFVFGTIIMDACLFISRVVTFTFSGIVAYPKESYGYLIFAFTIVYYICQSVHEFSLKYQSLLKDTIAVCEHMQRANDATKLIARNDGLKGIRIELFERVINEHCPKRRQVFICFVKVCVIIIAYGLAINLLLQTDGFRKLQTLTHAGTVIFVCALPQITRSICKKSTGIFKKKKLRIEISHTISDYFGYFNMVDPSGIEMVDEE